jgi:predicted lipid-binding transport protein (Tim44 family)
VKALVDGLDTMERNLGIAAVVLAIVLDFVNFYANLHSPTKDVKSAAEFLLISNLIFAGILALGLGLRRRALLGFGAFFFGLEQAFSEHQYSLGLPFIAFGGWLIMRASQKQKQSRPTRVSRSTPKANAKSPKAAAGRPKASKRYTPPQRARGSAGK